MHDLKNLAPSRFEFTQPQPEGQRQLVGLVRALVKQPKILILDEATTAMDYRMERTVMDFVRNYVYQTGAGLLLISLL